VLIFRGLGIPCYFVFDGDVSRRGKSGEADAVRANQLLMRLAGVAPEDFPPSRVEATWAVVEDRLEAELKGACNDDDQWTTITQQVRDELGFDSVEQTLKNPDGAAAVTMKLYERGRSLSNLEAVAERVTSMLGSTDLLAMGSCVMPS
jgi:hypothetical protein